LEPVSVWLYAHYHYLFPQLTMGLGWFLVYWKWRALKTGDEKYNQAVRFWAKIFGLNFAVGVVTGAVPVVLC
jgi:cytochrome bd ubiquinol oxidase subunit I